MKKLLRSKYKDDFLWLGYSVLNYIEVSEDYEILKERKGHTRHGTNELPKNVLKTKIFNQEINIVKTNRKYTFEIYGEENPKPIFDFNDNL